MSRAKLNTYTQCEPDDVLTAAGTLHLTTYSYQLKCADDLIASQNGTIAALLAQAQAVTEVGVVGVPLPVADSVYDGTSGGNTGIDRWLRNG